MDRIEEIETEIWELETRLEEEDLTDEEIGEIKDQIEELEKQLEDEWFIKKYGLDAYYGVSPRDFF